MGAIHCASLCSGRLARRQKATLHQRDQSTDSNDLLLQGIASLGGLSANQRLPNGIAVSALKRPLIVWIPQRFEGFVLCTVSLQFGDQFGVSLLVG